MRIVGGYLRGKKIFDSIDKSTRPLKDIVRESIFNVLEHSKNESVDLKEAKVLDLFSGTGSFGIECLSRGAKKVVFFENYQKSIEILIKNIEKLNLSLKSKVINKNAYNLKNSLTNYNNFDLIFIDPPFKDMGLSNLILKIKKLKIFNKKTIIVIHRNKKIKEILSNDLLILKEKNYGLSKIIFCKIN